MDHTTIGFLSGSRVTLPTGVQLRDSPVQRRVRASPPIPDGQRRFSRRER